MKSIFLVLIFSSASSLIMAESLESLENKLKDLNQRKEAIERIESLLMAFGAVYELFRSYLISVGQRGVRRLPQYL